MNVYLESLTRRLTRGAETFSPEFKAKHAAYLRSFRGPDGGFRGRSDESDLYYTGFALRGLAILGELDVETAAKATGYLRRRLKTKATIIDFMSLLYGALLVQVAHGHDPFEGSAADWPEAVAATLESLRRPDGGYAKSEDGSVGSTYHGFLVVLCLQLLGRDVPDPAGLVRFMRAQQRDDGGFTEIVAQKRSGTNPTAAATAVLQILGALDDVERQDIREFLLEMQGGEGGLHANSRIAVADVLSTFTGLLTLCDLGAKTAFDAAAAERYVRSMELPEGGFRGAELDPEGDVEYTFYGLGTLALLADPG